MSLHWAFYLLSPLQKGARSQHPFCTQIEKKWEDGGWHFPTSFWAPLRGVLFLESIHLEDPCLWGSDCCVKNLAVCSQHSGSPWGPHPFPSTAKREAPGLCSPVLVDLSFPAAAVFRSELLPTACWFSRGLFFFILGDIVYYFILAKATRCIFLWGKKINKYLRGLEGRDRVSWECWPLLTQAVEMGFGSVKKQPCQGKDHQTKAGENGIVLDDTCGPGFLPRGMQWLRGRRK